MKIPLSILLASLAAAVVVSVEAGKDKGENWVVLVGSSSGYMNYADEANVCHVYQIVHERGIPDDHIVLMMTDGIATSSMNPFPGKIFNRPGGPDVYHGVVKDYTGSDVSPDNFLKLLSGDAEGLSGIGSGKVVESGPNDRIFVFMTDHGNTGIFAFGSEVLYARDLADTVLTMHENQQFKEMMIYLESCYSGSMFEDLYPEDIGFYALSASNPHESAYRDCWDGDIGAYIASEFGFSWMLNTEENNITAETLGDQFEYSKSHTPNSEVCAYGQLDIQQETISTFFGTDPGKYDHYPYCNHAEPVPKKDLPLFTIKKKISLAKSKGEREFWSQELTSLMKRRQFVDDIAKEITVSITQDSEVAQTLLNDKTTKIRDWDCYEEAADSFHNKCFNLGQNPHALSVMPTFVNLCENGHSASTIVSAINGVCTFQKMTGIE